MNVKQLTMSLLLVSVTGFTGVAMAAGGSRGGVYPADPVPTQSAAPTAESIGNGRINMDACPMMSGGNGPMTGHQHHGG